MENSLIANSSCGVIRVNMTDKGVRPITEKFLDEGSLFGISFSQGIVFLEVTGWEQVKFSPYDEIGAVQPGSQSGFQRLNDSSGDDILFVEKREKKVLHTGIGMSPRFMRRYTNYPEGEVRLRRMPNLGTPTGGDDFGYVDGSDSPFNEPTDAEELMIPPGVHLDFNFYNPDNEQRTPVLNIVNRVYRVRPLDPNNSDDKKMIERIVAPGSPMPIHPAGSPRRKTDYELKQHWGVEPISREEAKK